MPQEKINCFVDSNVWLYAFLQQSPSDKQKTDKANALLKNNQLNVLLSTQVINEVCFNLRKKANFSETDLLTLINNFYDNYTVITLEISTLCLAAELRQAYLLSFWDSLVISTALQANAEIIYTEDMQDGLIIYKTLTITNPFN